MTARFNPTKSIGWINRRFRTMVNDLHYATALSCVGKTDFTFTKIGYVNAELKDDTTYTLICTFPNAELEHYDQIIHYLMRSGKQYHLKTLKTSDKLGTIDPCDTPSTDPNLPQPATLATS